MNACRWKSDKEAAEIREMKDLRTRECSYEADVVSYLYKEMPKAEAEKFELHLGDCARCMDELADLSLARLEVYEWHRDEFAAMETPKIVIPYGEQGTASWLDAVRGWFASPVQWAGAGAFAVAILAAGVWLAIPRLGNVVAVNTEPTPMLVDKQPVGIPEGPDLTARPKAETRPAVESPDPAVVKASVRRSAKASDSKPAKAKPERMTDRRTAPRLNDFDDDEDDTTLRLGELLAEIDTIY